MVCKNWSFRVNRKINKYIYIWQHEYIFHIYMIVILWAWIYMMSSLVHYVCSCMIRNKNMIRTPRPASILYNISRDDQSTLQDPELMVYLPRSSLSKPHFETLPDKLLSFVFKFGNSWRHMDTNHPPQTHTHPHKPCLYTTHIPLSIYPNRHV